MGQRTKFTPAVLGNATTKSEAGPLNADSKLEMYIQVAEETVALMASQPGGRELLLKFVVLWEHLANSAARGIVQATAYLERVDAATPINGYEELFAHRLKYTPLMNRFLAYAIQNIGAQFVRERNDVRYAGRFLTRIAKPLNKSLSVSRSAKQLAALLRSGYAGPAFSRAIEEAKVSLTYFDFEELVEQASRRDEAAILLLREACRDIRLKLSNLSGPPMNDNTGIHAVLIAFLQNFDKAGTYTYTWNGKFEDSKAEWLHTRSQINEDNDTYHDYDDELTLATRRALKNRNFRPSRSIRILTSGEFSLADGSVSRSRSKGDPRKVS